MGDRYVPRPRKRAGARIPVHVMRRFFNLLSDGRCAGIETRSRGDTLHDCSFHFNTSAEAHEFYRALEAIYEASR